MNNLQAPIDRLYHLILRAYPPEYMETFGDEMQNTFIEGWDEARSQGELGTFILRELRDMPTSLVNAYWHRWQMKLLGGIQLLQEATSSSDLPPVPPDGRNSWWQVLWETSMFAITGLLLILVTYFQFNGLHAGWQHNTEFIGSIVVPMALPFFLFGLARGLPRWAYPFGGLLLSYYGLVAEQTNLWLFLIVMLFATVILMIATIITDPQPLRLPIPIRRLGQSLSIDWTRLSFGISGAMPLIILMAFDNAYTNSRTPYLAFSVLTMIVSTILYCRSRETKMQIAILLTGLTFSIFGAWLDELTFVGSLVNWITVTPFGHKTFFWIIVLWIQWSILLLSPTFLILVNKVVHVKRAI